MIKLDWTSPGLWAQSITQGRWQAYDHLIPLDLALSHAAHVPDSRVIVEMPPRHGKSTLSSVYFPSWYRLRWPDRNIALWSATGRLAQRFSKHTRDISSEVAASFGWKLDEATKAWEHWKLADTPPNCGEFYGSGVGGGSTMGTGSHLLIIDDFFKDVESALSPTIRQKQEEWYLSCVTTRMEPGASIVIIATRWHRDDLIGFVLREALQTGEEWHRIRMPAISQDEEGNDKALWPERFPVKKLEQTRRRFEVTGYPWMWNALYQQEPPEVLDAEWDPSYFHEGIYFDHWPPDNEIVLRLTALDPSLGEGERADYSAFVDVVVDNKGHFWIEADLARRDAAAQAFAAVIHVRDFKSAVFAVETNNFQEILSGVYEAYALRHRVSVPVWKVHSSKKKRIRIRGLISPHLSAGRLHFLRNNPGCNLLLEQLRGFPTHQFDDGPDALAMAIEVAGQVIHGQAQPIVPEVVVT